jgi:hypothetical protein
MREEIRDLLANGDSPLYHPAVHVSELYATVYYIRAGLVSDHASRLAPELHITDDRRIRRGCSDASPGETRHEF